jgi:hypothetical protein
VRDAGSLFVAHSYALLANPIHHPNSMLAHAHIHAHSGVISHFVAISYFAHITAHSCARFNALAQYFPTTPTHSFTSFHLLGHINVLAMSVPVSPIFAHIDSGLYAQYVWTNSFQACQNHASCSACAFCSSRSCQNVLSENQACIAVQIKLHGIYCHAFEKKDAVSPITFGTSDTTPPITFQIKLPSFCGACFGCVCLFA